MDKSTDGQAFSKSLHKPVSKDHCQPVFGEAFGTNLSKTCLDHSGLEAQDFQEQKQKPPISEEATQEAAYNSWGDYLGILTSQGHCLKK
jgi:hypothetical protein